MQCNELEELHVFWFSLAATSWCVEIITKTRQDDDRGQHNIPRVCLAVLSSVNRFSYLMILIYNSELFPPCIRYRTEIANFNLN